MSVHRVRGRNYDEVFVSHELAAKPDEDQLSSAIRQFRDETGGIPLSAVVFGTIGERSVSPEGVPAVYAGDQYPRSSPSAAVEIRGIVPTGEVSVSTRRAGSVTVTSEGVRRLVCAVASPTGTSFREQAQDVFDAVAKAIAEAGLEPRHIVRTWYFISDISANYAEFNTVRDARFDEWGLRNYPASTGIGAALPGTALISVLVEATDAVCAAPEATFNTSLQCPPVAYGPRFVRANDVTYNEIRTVNISGISSIGQDGESVTGHLGVLVDHTMTSFLDLLVTTGMTVDDIASAYVYCKGGLVREAYEKYLDTHGLAFPQLINHVDVCRPDLSLEIEAKALRPTAGVESRP